MYTGVKPSIPILEHRIYMEIKVLQVGIFVSTLLLLSSYGTCVQEDPLLILVKGNDVQCTLHL